MRCERISVSNVDCENYQKNILPTILIGYNRDSVFNADKTGFFFNACLTRCWFLQKKIVNDGVNKANFKSVLIVAGNEKLELMVIRK